MSKQNTHVWKLHHWAKVIFEVICSFNRIYWLFAIFFIKHINKCSFEYRNILVSSVARTPWCSFTLRHPRQKMHICYVKHAMQLRCIALSIGIHLKTGYLVEIKKNFQWARSLHSFKKIKANVTFISMIVSDNANMTLLFVNVIIIESVRYQTYD